jgi:hypothetical protein
MGGRKKKGKITARITGGMIGAFDVNWCGIRLTFILNMFE